MRRQIEWVNVARGIAILAVIVGHTLGPYTGQRFGSIIFAVHMPIFFILSGYLHHQRPPRQALRHDAPTLLLPYAATGGVLIVLNWLAQRLPANPILTAYFPNGRHAVLAILYGAGSPVFGTGRLHVQPVGAIWFLLCLLLAKQLFNAILQLTHDWRQPLLMRLLLIGGCGILGGWLGLHIYLPWALNAALLAQVFLYAGYLIRQTKLLQRLSDWWQLLWVTLWAGSALQGYFVMTIPRAPHLVIAVAGGIGGSLVLIRLSQLACRWQSSWPVQALIKCGRGSLIILCFHLVDLNVIGLEGWLYGHLLPMTGPLVATVVGISYRTLFALGWLVVVPHLPMLRVCFYPRRYLARTD